MAYEILNNARVTPHRLHALVRLVPRLETPTRQDLYNLLQPSALASDGKQDLAADVLRAAATTGLVTEDPETKRITLTQASRDADTVEGFRLCMQRTLLGSVSDDQPNYLLGQFTAWYAAQDERVLAWDPKQYEERFCADLYPGRGGDERPFNTTKYNGWQSWAVFLGWCWPMKLGGRQVCLPDARLRIEPLLNELLPDGKHIIEFGRFADMLSQRCPELDGGVLFDRSWSASRGNERRGNRLSLMLSTALRVLHDAQLLELIRRPDATMLWQLYPSASHGFYQISHIRRRGEE